MKKTIILFICLALLNQGVFAMQVPSIPGTTAEVEGRYGGEQDPDWDVPLDWGDTQSFEDDEVAESGYNPAAYWVFGSIATILVYIALIEYMKIEVNA